MTRTEDKDQTRISQNFPLYLTWVMNLAAEDVKNSREVISNLFFAAVLIDKQVCMCSAKAHMCDQL